VKPTMKGMLAAIESGPESTRSGMSMPELCGPTRGRKLPDQDLWAASHHVEKRRSAVEGFPSCDDRSDRTIGVRRRPLDTDTPKLDTWLTWWWRSAPRPSGTSR
jgi:hypothetical protein